MFTVVPALAGIYLGCVNMEIMLERYVRPERSVQFFWLFDGSQLSLRLSTRLRSYKKINLNCVLNGHVLAS